MEFNHHRGGLMANQEAFQGLRVAARRAGLALAGALVLTVVTSGAAQAQNSICFIPSPADWTGHSLMPA